MLKKFFLNALSSFLGTWVALIIFCAVSVMVVIGMIARLGMSSEGNQQVKKGSVLVMDLTGEIVENDMPVEFDYTGLLQGEITKKKTLHDITLAIEDAAENKNIDAIYLKCGVALAAPATYNAIRNSLLKFKESGKKIIAYSEIFPMGAYYVATVADELYMNPNGSINLQGLGGTSMFFKGLFDKIGIEFQVVKVGTYKSAVEPYISEHMSSPARAQLDTLYGNIWNFICEGISSRRKDLTVEGIDSLVNNQFIFLKDGKTAKQFGLVDQVYYERSMDSVIAASLNKKKDDLNFIDPSLLISQDDILKVYSSKNQIAVIYATGEIIDGGPASSINYKRFVPIITELADDDNVKGMVLRVNSPGGSVFGSEQIGDALDYFQSKGKPLVVSMGDYAASGGYWISCCADKIYADPLTITGSIGIFGLIPNAQKLLEKIGLNTELVSTNPEAAFPDLYHALTPRQLDAMQQMVSKGYDDFVKRVSKGRNLSESEVRRIGEGRVWSAESAVKIGLVDSLGGLQDAINWVSEKIETDNYTIAYYPRIKSTVLDFLPQMLEMNSKSIVLRNIESEIPFNMLDFIYKRLFQYPIQARMPEMKVTL